LIALSTDFNKRNADTSNIPSVFKPYATSMDLNLRSQRWTTEGTTGVVRKYTPISYWMSDDKMGSMHHMALMHGIQKLFEYLGM
jgi:hypothetical protein